VGKKPPLPSLQSPNGIDFAVLQKQQQPAPASYY
jgi:hypothetical protein